MSAVLNIVSGFEVQGGTSYLSAAAPSLVQGWSSLGDDLRIVKPLASQETGTWVIVTPMFDRPRSDRNDVVATKLRALHNWLDSLPEVPSIPLDALDRDNLY